MRRRVASLLPMAIIVCLIGADGPNTPAAQAAPANPTPAAPPQSPLRDIGAPTAESVQKWCSLEEQGAITLVSDLRARDLAITEREHLLQLREKELQESEKRLVSRVETLKKLRDELTDQLKRAETIQEDKVTDLVKMVEANRPSAISGMFETLDEALAVQVLDRMNTSKAGKLLAVLTPAKAARLAEKMTHPVAPDPTPEESPVASAVAPPAASTPPTPPAASPPAASTPTNAAPAAGSK